MRMILLIIQRITFIVILSSGVVFWTSKRWYENKLKKKCDYLTVGKIINNAVDKIECVYVWKVS